MHADVRLCGNDISQCRKRALSVADLFPIIVDSGPHGM